MERGIGRNTMKKLFHTLVLAGAMVGLLWAAPASA